MSNMVKKLDVVRANNGFSARGFALGNDERVAADYAAFDRNGREPRMVPIAAGQEFTALTDANDNGWFYARVEFEGKTFACLIVNSYKKVQAAA